MATRAWHPRRIVSTPQSAKTRYTFPVTGGGLPEVWVGVAMAIGSGVVAALGLALVLRHAARLGLVQAPNERSSHVRPTPTGGGVGIVLGGAFAALVLIPEQPWPAIPVLLAALGFAVLGLWDDITPLSPAIRFPAQLALTALTLAVALPLNPLAAALGLSVSPGWLFVPLLLGIVYWVNLFNFMDGIDGLAGSEALFMLLAPLGLALVSASAPLGLLFWWPLALAVAVGVFLAINWQPARIFMGDAGSTFLGFLIVVFGLLQIAAGWIGPWEVLILGACFATDGTVTLARRALQGESIVAAHRRHAYQQLARRYSSHQRVVLSVTAINLLWLLPLALAAHLDPPHAPLFAFLAYVPLVAIALAAGAGRPEHA